VDLATLNVCCAVDAAGRIRFAYGAVAPTPVLVDDLPPHHAGPAAEDALVERALACLSPISDVRGSRDYRLAMIDVMTRRALRRALDSLARAPETPGEAER
jgi:carbon-monoxide dehydrogenase medium subunit